MATPNPTLLQASARAGGNFDRNAASRMLSQEFAALRQKYGDAGIRAAGFTPQTLAQLQAPLRALQMNNASTFDAHQSAVNDALAKLRSYNFGGSQAAPQAPVQMQQPSPMASLMANLKTMAQPAQSNPAFVGQNFTGSPPPPGMKWVETGEGLVPVPINEGAAPSVPSGPALGQTLGMPQMQPQFDRNAALQQFNQTFSDMRQKYGNSNLTSQGFKPSDLASLQAGLRTLQMDPNSTQAQHQAALQNALNTLNSRVTMPVELPQPEIAQPAAPVPTQPVGALTAATQPAATPAPQFDRNAALQQLNQTFSGMRQNYGDDRIRSAGFSPRDFAALQGTLRTLQMDPNSTQAQHQAALQSAMGVLNSRMGNIPGVPQRPAQPAATPAPQMPGAVPGMIPGR